MRLLSCFILILVFGLLPACTEKKGEELPILGRKKIEGKDTIYHTIPDFQFVDQDSTIITGQTFDGKVYVADFFFTSCPTICPKMKVQMLRVYEQIKDLDHVALLSHTIDPDHDSVALLHDYAGNMNVSSDKWHFVTGVKDAIYEIAQTGYFATVMENESEPGGFIHSGAFLLVDQKKRIRGKYDGTDKEEVDELIEDIKRLLNEKK